MSEQSLNELEQPRRVERGHMGKRIATLRDDRVNIEKQKRMHKFQSGMHDVGRPIPMWSGSLREAKQLHEMLELLLYDEEELNLAQ